MIFFSIKKIMLSFFNIHSSLTFFSILIHQSLIALSVYASIKLIGSIDDGSEKSMFFWLMIYLSSTILPHIVGFFSDILKERWLCSIFNEFWISAKNKYRISTSPNIKEEPLGILSSQGKEIISDFISYIFYGFSSLLNFILSLLIISIFIDSRFLISVIISVFLVIIVNFMFAKKLEKLALVKSGSGSRLVTTLTLTHDNLHHGSRINIDFFMKKLKGDIENYLFRRIKEKDVQSSILLLTSLIALIPTSVLVVNILLQPDISSEIKLALIVNLTRIFHLLNSATNIIEIIISFPSYKGRLRVLKCFSQEVEKPYNNIFNIEIYKNNILLNNNDVSSNCLGRFSIKGNNGSGKSTYLKCFRDKYDAIYFNPSFKVLYPWEDETSFKLSDGQYSKKCILWLLNNTDGPLLLDEWDAFLDKENSREVSKIIDASGHSRLILEVRQ